jgi:site-specific recombinase XerC
MTDKKERFLVELFVRTGITVREMAYLRIRHLTEKRGFLLVPKEATKCKKGRMVRLSPEIMASFDAVFTDAGLHGPDFLFSTRQSKRMSERRIQQIIAKRTKECFGAPLHPRMLRESYVMHALSNHIPLHEIEESLGVRSISPYVYRFMVRR